MSLSRDNFVSRKNRLIEAKSIYLECEKRYNVIEDQIERLCRSNQEIENDFDSFNTFRKVQSFSLEEAIDLFETLNDLLSKYKRLYSVGQNELYLAMTFKSLLIYQAEYIKSEPQDIAKLKQDILYFIITILLLKQKGHLLIFNVFLGWATHFSQVFERPDHPNAVNIDSIPLFEGKIIDYLNKQRYVSFTLASLICVNVFDLIYEVRMSSNDEEYQRMDSQAKLAFENMLNTDLESEDLYWNFVEFFFEKNSQSISHTAINVIVSWCELSFLRMKCAAKLPTGQVQLNPSKAEAKSIQDRYEALFGFVANKIVTRTNHYLIDIKNRAERDPHLIRLILNNKQFTDGFNTEYYDKMLQIISQLSNIEAEFLQRIHLYRNQQLFNEQLNRNQTDGNKFRSNPFANISLLRQ